LSGFGSSYPFAFGVGDPDCGRAFGGELFDFDFDRWFADNS
jgi:hypothetical protein